jgi:hypothetical protein
MRNLLFGVVILGAACGGDDAQSGAPPTVAQQFCGTLAASMTDCVATPCDDALVADCADVAAVLSDPLLRAAGACLDGDGTPSSCLVLGAQDLAPTAAHAELATAFCAGCALGVPGCEETFFDAEADGPRLGALMLPFGDDVVREITSSCTQSLGCAATFPTCVQQTLAKRAIPEETIGCLVGALLEGPAAAPPTCAAGGGGEGGGLPGGSTSASVSASSSTSSSASASSSSSSTGGGSGGECGPSVACAAASEIELSGDEPTTKTSGGHTSAWYKVSVLETDLGILNNHFGVRVEVSSVPLDAAYELWIYDNGGCAMPLVQGGGSPLAAELIWPDTAALDARTLTVEVRHVSGPCEPTEPWTLTVESF